MNKQYRIVWNACTSTWVAVAEIARSHGKSKGTHSGGASRSVQLVLRPVALALALWGGGAYAGPPAPNQLPTGGQVVAGQAAIGQTGPAALSVNQSSPSAVIHWNTFNLGSAAQVNFAQPNSSAAVLNRVLDANPSQIYGRITAPGQVFFTNPSGMYFAPGASVDVGSFTATTHSISTADFMAGNYRFTREGATGAIVNEGQIQAALGGYVALLAPEVRNHGVVLAQMGTVALAAGEAYQLQIQGSRLSHIEITPATIHTLVDNGQAVLAPDGWIILSAQAAQQLEASVVNTGQLSANSLVDRGGRIVLESSGTLSAGGSIQANSAMAQGGQVTLTGQHIHVPAGADIQAQGATGGGTVLVGGDWQGSGALPQATTVTMEAGASIDASATQRGDGGKVVLWSDVHQAEGQTTVHGSITARGGVLGGKGGQVETSGHQVDIAGASVNAGADQGPGGLWLLDPYDYTIGTTEAATIKASLDGGTSFTLDTASSPSGTSPNQVSGASGTGHITVNSAIAKTAGGDATLTLKAAGNITVNGDITSTSNKLNVVLWTNSAGGSTSYAAVGGVNVTTNGGHFWMGGGSGSTTWNGLTVGDSWVTMDTLNQIAAKLGGTNLSTAGGHVSIAGKNTVSAGTGSWIEGILLEGAQVSTGGGSITLDGRASGAASIVSGIEMRAGTTLASGGGNISITGQATGLTLAGSTAYGVYQRNQTTVSSGAGAINYDGRIVGASDAPNSAGVWVGTSAGGAGDGNQSAGAGSGYNNLINSTSGAISLYAQNGSINSGGGYAHALVLSNNGSDVQGVKSGSGAITLQGNMALGSTAYGGTDSNGLLIDSQSTTGKVQVVSGSGNITLIGVDYQSGSQGLNGMRLNAANAAASIQIGDDGSNTYSGNIELRADALLQGNTQAGAGSIGVRSTGTLSINPRAASTSFSHLRAGASGVLTFDDDWNFGSSLSGLTIGKSGNTSDLTLSNAITTAGNISLYGNNLTLSAALSKTGGGDATLLAKAAGNITVNGDITSTSNKLNTVLWANSAGGSSVYVAVGGVSVTTNGGHFWVGGGTGSTTWNNLTVGDGAVTTTAINQIAAKLGGTTLTTGGGAVSVAGQGLVSSGTGQWLNGVLLEGAQVSTSGGAITLWGSASGAATSVAGIEMRAGTTLASAGGNVSLTGTGTTLAGVANSLGFGIYLHDKAAISSGAGSIGFDGRTGETAASFSAGIYIGTTAYGAGDGSQTTGIGAGYNTLITSTSGAISMYAQNDSKYANTDGTAYALTMANVGADGVAIKSGSGAISLQGNVVQGSAPFGGLLSSGMYFYNTASANKLQVVSQSGAITLIGVNYQNDSTNRNGLMFDVGDAANAVQIGDDGSNTYSGNIDIRADDLKQVNTHAGEGSISVRSSGTLKINPLGVSTSFNHLRAGSGTLTFDDDWNFGSTLSGLTIGKSGNTSDLTLSSAITTAGNITLYGAALGGSGNLDAGGGTVTFAASGNGTYSGAISGTGGVTKTGSGTQILSGANSYTGATAVSAGTLQAGSSTAFGNNSAVTLANVSGATLALNGNNVAIGSLAGGGSTGGNVTLGAGTLSTGGKDTSTLYAGAISGTGGLTKAGTGTQTLTAANTYTGTTTVSAGTLLMSNTASSGSYSIASGAVLEYNVATGTTLDLGGSNKTYSGAGTLRKSGAGTLAWWGNSTGVGTFALDSGASIDVQGGIFTGSNDGNEVWTHNKANLHVASGATFAGNEGVIRVNALTGAGTVSTGYTGFANGGITVGVDNGSGTFSGVIANTNTASGHTGKLTKEGTGTQTLTGNSTYTGATTLSAGTLVLQNDAPSSASSQFSGPGSLVIESSGASFSAGFSTSGWTFDSATPLGGLTLGKVGNTAAITVANAVTVAGPVNVYGGDIAVNAALTASGSNTITLAGSGNVTDGASGSLSADKLLLSGGNVTLDSTSNAIGTLAASGVGALSYVDSHALTLGTVGATNGISASGVVNISTLSGDLTVSQALSTSNTTASALTLNAGSATAALTTSGGNLIVSGSGAVSVGAGGTATLYTGGISGSTGLATLVGSSSGRFRYGSDESTTNYTLALSTGLNAIYREQPTVTRAVDNKTITYGDALPSYSFSISGGSNGDTYAQAFGSATAPTVTVGGSQSSTNNYTAGAHTLSATGGASTSQLGYAVSGSSTSGTLTVSQKAITVSGITAAGKTYDGDRTATVNTSGAGGWVVGDAVSVSATGQFDTKDKGTNKTVTLSSSYTGGDLGNYIITDQASTSASIAAKTVTLSASKTYDGGTSLTGAVTIGGTIGSETLTYSGATANDAHVATSGKFINAITLADGGNGGLASNYALPTLNAANAAVTITAKALTSTASIGGTTTKTYDGGTSATGASVSGTVSGAVGGDTINLDTSGLSLAYNNAHVVGASSIAASGTAGFTIASSTSGSQASDYSFTGPTISSASASITARALTATASITGSGGKTYDGTTTATGVSVSGTVAGAITGDTVVLDTSGLSLAYNSARVAGATAIVASGTADFSITNSSNASVASDYSFTAPTIAAKAASIAARALTASSTITGTTSKTYDGSTSTSASLSTTFSGQLSGDSLTLSGLTLAYNDAHVAGASSIAASGSAGFTIGSSSAGSVASDYSFSAPSIAAVSASITARALTASLTNTGVSKTYDGSTGAPAGFVPGYSFVGLIAGDTAANLSNTGAAYNSKNVTGASKLTVSGLAITGVTGSNSSAASDYALSVNSADVAASITPKNVTVTGLAVSDKTYDGTTAASVSSWGSVSTGVGSETLSVLGSSASFASANVAFSGGTPQAQTVTASGYTLGDGTGAASNYQLTSTSASSSAKITPAALTVTANSDAKFVTRSDTSGYAGVSYSGFVNGETATVLSGSVSIGRSNSATQTAGTYSGVLVPTGLSASNYSIRYVNGDYTIVPSNQLLVKVSNASTVYGTSAAYSVASAQYYDSAADQVVTLGSVNVNANNQVTVNDGAGGTASFTLAPQSAAYSGANLLRVGSYQLGITGPVTENSQNFSNTITVVGAQTVTPKGLSASVTAGLSKTYDGSAAINGMALGLAGTVTAASAVQAGDTVTVSGSGAYAGQNAGSNLNYTVSNLALSGADAGNYVLSSTSLSGSNGTITAKALTLSANKTYDGGTSLAGAVTLGGLVGSETLGYSGATASSARVAASGKYISAITLADGSNGGLATNYVLPTLDAANAPVTITAKALTANASITGASSKTYDGTTAATGASVSGTVSGAVAGDTLTLDSSGVSLAYNSARVAGASSISATGTLALGISGSNGSQLSDYSFSAPTIAPVVATITPAALAASLSNAPVSKTYDGSTAAPAGFTPSWSFSGLVAGDSSAVLTHTSSAFNSANVSSAHTLTVSGLALSAPTGSRGSVASDYQLTTSSAQLSASITPKTVTVTGLAAQGKTYDGNTSATIGHWGAVSTGVGSETLTLNHGSASFASAHAGTDTVTASGYSLADGSQGGLASNYQLASTSASTTATIDQKALTLSANKTYDGGTSLAGAVTLGGLVGSETLGYSGATASSARVAASGKYISAITLADGSNGGLATNYVLPTLDAANAPVTITAKALTANASITGASSKTYDGTTAATGASVSGTVSGAVAGDTLTLDSSGVSLAYNSARVAGASSISATGTLALGISGSNGSQLSDYSFSVPALASVAGTITPKALSASASIGGALSKTYDGSTQALGATVSGSISGALAGDSLSLDIGGLSLAYNSARVAGAHSIVASGTLGFGMAASSLGSQASDYSFSAPTVAPASASITPRVLVASLGNVGVSKTYDGTTAAPAGFAPVWNVRGLLDGDTAANLSFASAAYNSQNVAQATQVLVTVAGQSIGSITGSLNSAASDYALSSSSASVTASITPKTVALTGLQVANKTYDGTTTTTVTDWGSVSTGVGSETLLLNHGAAVFDSANAGSRTATATGYSLQNGGSGGLASNYQLASTSASTTATIDKAALTIAANNDAKFVTTSDVAHFAGVSYSGFVNGETSAVLSAAPSIARSNASVHTAGTYSGALVPSGAVASNYNIQYVNGDFTIVPANQLLVRLNNLSTVYGSAATYSIASASYFDADAQQVVTLADSAVRAGNVATVHDGAGGSASFTLAPLNASRSSSQLLRVGTYQLGSAGTVTENSQNFSNTVTVVGAHTVTPKALAAVTTSGIAKTYDGSTGMLGVAFALTGVGSHTGVEASDAVTVSGNGDFASKNAGSNVGYTVNNLALGGADASNYYLAAGSSFSGSDGTIAPRALVISARPDHKTFDGSTRSGLVPQHAGLGSGPDAPTSGLLAGDSLSDLTQAFDSSAVGQRALNVTAYTLADGNGGHNYSVTLVPANGSIVAIQPPPPPLPPVSTPPGGSTDRGQDGTGAGGGTDTGTGGGFGPGDGPDQRGGPDRGPDRGPDPDRGTSPAGGPDTSGGTDRGDGAGGGSGGGSGAETGSRSGGGSGGGSGAGQGSADTGHNAQGGSSASVRVMPVRDVASDQVGLTRVYVPRELIGVDGGFSFTVALPALERPEAVARATLRDGAPLPAWLSFDGKALRFTASKVPVGGLPLSVRVQQGALVLEVDLFEASTP